MTTSYENALSYRQVLVTSAAQCVEYNWSADFIKSRMEAGRAYASRYTVDPEELTEEELKLLGCRVWDNTQEDKLYLLPLWLLACLPKTVNLMDISGHKVTQKDKIDNDERYGMLAYGKVVRKQEVVA